MSIKDYLLASSEKNTTQIVVPIPHSVKQIENELKSHYDSRRINDMLRAAIIPVLEEAFKIHQSKQ